MATKNLATTAVVRMRLNAFWAKQEPGVPISVRELFQYGPEQLVYLVMSEFARNEKVERVAWGVYMLPNKDGTLPPVKEVAIAKARGFGKDILQLPKEFQKSIKSKNKTDEKTVSFATSGCTSSFRFAGKVVRFYKVANRKFELLKSRLGSVFATVWKKQLARKTDIKRVFKDLNVEKAELRGSSKLLHLLPMWLKNVMRDHYPEMTWQPSSVTLLARAGPGRC